VKKSLFLVLVTAISLALLFTGNIIEDEHYAFDMPSGRRRELPLGHLA
jgi:hypothetical protein